MLSLRASPVVRTRPAFTLLELVIVLVIMVGLTAIAWPNLARQLRKSELRESAQLLRSAIEECGYRAASEGQPTLLKLVEGSGAIALISPSDLTQEAARSISKPTSELALETDEALGSSLEASTPQGSGNRTWEFPGAVVLRSVRWKLEVVKTQVFESEDVGDRAFEDAGTAVAEVDTEAEFFGVKEPLSPGKVWWMPFVAPSNPSGVGREATIELYDKASEETLRVTYDPVSGRVEVLP